MSEILRRIDELSESLDVYQKHLSTLNPEELILFYETVDSDKKNAIFFSASERTAVGRSI